jgi:hypothetical protein
MPQLYLYLPESISKALKERARARGMTISRYLAELVQRQLGGDWPPDFFEEVVGGWKGEPLDRPPQGELEARENL